MRQKSCPNLNLCHCAGTKQERAKLAGATKEAGGVKRNRGTPIDRSRATAPISSPLSGGDKPL
jgi:hypothetical protein